MNRTGEADDKGHGGGNTPAGRLFSRRGSKNLSPMI
jgi:hypothetical protein